MNLKFDIIGVGVFVENTNKIQDPRQSMDPKILADLRPQADSSAVRTSLQQTPRLKYQLSSTLGRISFGVELRLVEDQPTRILKRTAPTNKHIARPVKFCEWPPLKPLAAALAGRSYRVYSEKSSLRNLSWNKCIGNSMRHIARATSIRGRWMSALTRITSMSVHCVLIGDHCPCLWPSGEKLPLTRVH